MHRTRAFTVIRAASRMKVLAMATRNASLDLEQLEGEKNPALADNETDGLLSHDGKSTSRPSLARSSTGSRTPKTYTWQTDIEAAKGLVLGSYINLLLICAPLGILSGICHWNATVTFILNFLALVPLALILGDVTEDLALRFGDTIGGLLNATFGNVVEMILSIAALTKGLFDVVAASLLGSVLSNLLLVLGCCFFFGGIKFPMQRFNADANRASSSLLFLSAIGIIIPTAAKNFNDDGVTDAEVLSISRGVAVVLLFIYIGYLVFQLKTHHHLFAGEDDDAEDAILSTAGALVLLTIITVIVATCSEFLTGSIEKFSEETHISRQFLGMIVLPIAGNACEHITAVIVAMKDKMDLSLGVAMGSSIQISLLAIPFTVIVAWVLGLPFSMNFDPFATVALTFSVILANFITAGATSHWLMGVQLLAVYLLIGVTFAFR